MAVVEVEVASPGEAEKTSQLKKRASHDKVPIEDSQL